MRDRITGVTTNVNYKVMDNLPEQKKPSETRESRKKAAQALFHGVVLKVGIPSRRAASPEDVRELEWLLEQLPGDTEKLYLEAVERAYKKAKEKGQEIPKDFKFNVDKHTNAKSITGTFCGHRINITYTKDRETKGTLDGEEMDEYQTLRLWGKIFPIAEEFTKSLETAQFYKEQGIEDMSKLRSWLGQYHSLREKNEEKRDVKTYVENALKEDFGL